jgi:hypothetical protein
MISNKIAKIHREWAEMNAEVNRVTRDQVAYRRSRPKTWNWNDIYHEKDSSRKSTFQPSSRLRTARRSSSARPPVPQVLTQAAPMPSCISWSMRLCTLGRPGNIWTLDEGETISPCRRGRVTKSRILRISRRRGIARICVIHVRIHSRCSGD